MFHSYVFVALACGNTLSPVAMIFAFHHTVGLLIYEYHTYCSLYGLTHLVLETSVNYKGYSWFYWYIIVGWKCKGELTSTFTMYLVIYVLRPARAHLTVTLTWRGWPSIVKLSSGQWREYKWFRKIPVLNVPDFRPDHMAKFSSAGLLCIQERYLVITVPADVLAPYGARTSAVTVMIL